MKINFDIIKSVIKIIFVFVVVAIVISMIVFHGYLRLIILLSGILLLVNLGISFTFLKRNTKKNK